MNTFSFADDVELMLLLLVILYSYWFLFGLDNKVVVVRPSIGFYGFHPFFFLFGRTKGCKVYFNIIIGFFIWSFMFLFLFLLPWISFFFFHSKYERNIFFIHNTQHNFKWKDDGKLQQLYHTRAANIFNRVMVSSCLNIKQFFLSFNKINFYILWYILSDVFMSLSIGFI